MDEITARVPKGILFVLDPTNEKAVVPQYIDGELAAGTDTCVSVGTQAEVDGDVRVGLTMGGSLPSGLERAFVGSIVSLGGKIAVVTSTFDRLLELDVPAGRQNVSVWVDDLRHPAWVLVSVTPVSKQ